MLLAYAVALLRQPASDQPAAHVGEPATGQPHGVAIRRDAVADDQHRANDGVPGGDVAAALAAALGVTQTTVSRWESGAKAIGNATILEYALRYLLQQKRDEIDRALGVESEE